MARFITQSNAVIDHDSQAHLGRITAPTQITFGRHDAATSTRFAERLKRPIRNSELLLLEGCSHAPIYEKVEEFNGKTLEFLKRYASRMHSPFMHPDLQERGISFYKTSRPFPNRERSREFLI